jgi:hypothetical protein
MPATRLARRVRLPSDMVAGKRAATDIGPAETKETT